MEKQPLIQIEEMTKVFYTDEIETHALSGVRPGEQHDQLV